MTPRQDPLEERFEHLLREQVSTGAPDAMSGLVGDLRRAYARPLPMEVQNRQIASLVEAGREASASRPAPWRRRMNGVWYRFSQRFIAGSVVGKVILAASVATAATTGMAATGNLPDPMQIAISAAASHIGVSIPTPAPVPAPAAPGPSPAVAGRAPVANAPAAAPPASSPAPPPAGAAQAPQVPATTPADVCQATGLSASGQSPNADVLESLRKITSDPKKLEELLRCLVPTPTGAPPAPSSGDSPDALARLLEDLLGIGS
ncbi:MAG TPA: hypothetical protein VHJ78_08420 [Actinomycetota bacterium]|nr:hypothetical protein [Actinomycetota bacterium]